MGPGHGVEHVVRVSAEEEGVAGGDAGGAAASFDAVQEHPLAFAAQGLDGPGGVVEDEVEVRVGLGAGVDQPEPDVLGAELCGAHPAQADDRVVPAGTHRVDPADDHAVVVGVHSGMSGVPHRVVLDLDRRPFPGLRAAWAVSMASRIRSARGGPATRAGRAATAAGTAEAPQRAPSRAPAMAAVVSVSPPARTASSSPRPAGGRRWRSRG